MTMSLGILIGKTAYLWRASFLGSARLLREACMAVPAVGGGVHRTPFAPQPALRLGRPPRDRSCAGLVANPIENAKGEGCAHSPPPELGAAPALVSRLWCRATLSVLSLRPTRAPGAAYERNVF